MDAAHRGVTALSESGPVGGQAANAPVQRQELTSPAGGGVAPAQPSVATTPDPVPASTSTAATDSGHEPGKDYTEGAMREDSFLRKADKATIQTSGGANLFFKKGDKVGVVSAAGDWIEAKGTAYTQAKGAAPVAAGTHTGWIKRAWTTMTMGDYKDLPVDDRTGKYGGLASGNLPKSDVKSVTLHQTGGSSGADTLTQYDDRIKNNKTIGAHYLIDENGKIILTVPVDKTVSHVGKTKPGHAGTGDNSHAVGIEHSGAPKVLDLPSSATDTATLTKNRDQIKAAAIAPNLKQRLLAMTDAQLFQVAKDNRDPKKAVWYLYGDINAAQKRSSFNLSSKLMADFNLGEEDLLPHETVSWKTIGEGENIKEYMTARFAYPRLVTKLETLVQADPKLAADPALAKILADEKASVAALAVDATEGENSAMEAEKTAGQPGEAMAREALRTAFYGKFWERHTQLSGLVAFLEKSGSSQPTELATLTSAWVK